MAVDTLGHLLAWHVTPANEQEHAQVAQLAEQEQDGSDASMEVASVDQGDIGDRATQDAADHGIHSKWPIGRKRRRASCGCYGVGWSSAVLVGPRAFSASPAAVGQQQAGLS
jgi:hypothetical protein